MLFGRIADRSSRCDKNPLAAVNAVLGSLDVAPAISGDELGRDIDNG